MSDDEAEAGSVRGRVFWPGGVPGVTEDQPTTKGDHMKRNYRSTFDVYQSVDGFRWRLRSRNGNIVADSGEAYTTRADARRAARSVAWTAGGAKFL